MRRGRQRVQPHSNVKGEQIHGAEPRSRFSSPPSTPRVSASPSCLAPNHPDHAGTHLTPTQNSVVPPQLTRWPAGPDLATGAHSPSWSQTCPKRLPPAPLPTPFSALRPNPGVPFPSKKQPNSPGPVPDPPRTKWTSQVAARGLCPHGPGGACPGPEPTAAPAELHSDGCGSGTRAAAHLTARLAPRPALRPSWSSSAPAPSPAGRPSAPRESRGPTLCKAASALPTTAALTRVPQQPQPRTPNPRRVIRPGRTIRPACGGGARTVRARPYGVERANPPQVPHTREGRASPAT